MLVSIIIGVSVVAVNRDDLNNNDLIINPDFVGFIILVLYFSIHQYKIFTFQAKRLSYDELADSK